MTERAPRRGVRRLPTLQQALRWIDDGVEDVGGSGIARVQAIFVDADGGEPVWVIAKLGRFGKAVAIPIHDCAAVAGRVWVPHQRDVVRGAPSVDPEQPFAREHELAICAHYGIHEGHGRAAEVAAREPGAVTARPAGAESSTEEATEEPENP
jgi:hypothetical protein